VVNRAYLDSGIIMRLVEGRPERHAFLHERVRSFPLRVTSVIARTECLVIAIREQIDGLVSVYEEAFAFEELDVVEVDAAIADEAARIRASFNLKVPDAIHVATALCRGVTHLLTTDSDLVRCHQYKNLNVEVIPRVAIDA
jgi:predicted nucleic acid-binding protein